MKNYLISFLITAICIPFIVYGAEVMTGDQPSLSVGQEVKDDVYMVGGSVTSAGIVRGDLVAGGGTILVSGPVM
jgi:hypothetical protein